jgi:hypothetical protein
MRQVFLSLYLTKQSKSRDVNRVQHSSIVLRNHLSPVILDQHLIVPSLCSGLFCTRKVSVKYHELQAGNLQNEHLKEVSSTSAAAPGA